ncbi:MAG: type II secretion system F family protein [Treponema sp.]|nr:type II secretion system F family protein [Treponema sp.]
MKSMRITLHFSELLLALLRGKTSLADSLRILAGKGMEKHIRDCAILLLAAMKKGKSLSESLRDMQAGKVFFVPLYLTLIGAGELTGNIEDVLERIVYDLRRKQQARESVINILIYPAIVVFIAIAGTIAIIVKGMPLFITGGIVSANVVSDAKSGMGIAGVTLLLCGAAFFMVYFRIFYNDSDDFRIFYMLDFLLRSNIPLLEALSHCITSITNTRYGKILVSIKKDIASGVPFSQAFARIPHFPPYVTGWLFVAGANGNAADLCGTIKDYYSRKNEKIREIASKLVEPSVIVLTGIYVLIIMVTVILPILTYAGGTI